MLIQVVTFKNYANDYCYHYSWDDHYRNANKRNPLNIEISNTQLTLNDLYHLRNANKIFIQNISLRVIRLIT